MKIKTKSQKQVGLPTKKLDAGPMHKGVKQPGHVEGQKPSKSEDEKLQEILTMHRRFSSLGECGDMARRPQITDVEIVVSFTDIRGFTGYCNELQKQSLDSRIQNFLRDYLELYPIAILSEICRLDVKFSNQDLRRIIVPTTYKNLGDGVMLVWELPSSASNNLQGKASHNILKVLFTIFRLFAKRFRSQTPLGVDSYSDKAQELKLGCGVARGHAWKLDFGQNVKFDYAGSVVNLASRLADRARPEGIICQYELSHALFDRLATRKRGKVYQMKGLKGLGKHKVIALSQTEIELLWDKDDVWKGALE